MNDLNWHSLAKHILKAELARKGVNYQELSKRLIIMGLKDCAPSNLNSKINRGKFSFSFFLQCMNAIDTSEINIKGNNND